MKKIIPFIVFEALLLGNSAIAGPAAFLELADGTVDVVDHFITPDANGFYAVSVINEVFDDSQSQAKYKNKKIPFSEIKLIQWISPGAERMYYLDSLNAGVYQVTTLDGKKYESRTNVPIGYYTTGFSVAILGLPGQKREHSLQYQTTAGQEKYANAEVRQIVMNDPVNIEAIRKRLAPNAPATIDNYTRTVKNQQIKFNESIASFQSVLKVESETNCGPVIEIKGKLVKVYHPVPEYGNEHWMRKENLFPKRYDCRFVNGKYIPPM